MSISTSDLTIGYVHHLIQSHLSFDLFEGEFVTLLGRNGCGKSTLLKTLAGLQPALEGTFVIADTSSPRPIAVVLTERLEVDTMTVHDVVAMGRYPYTSFLGGLGINDEQIILDSLQAVGLQTLDIYRPIYGLSDGERTRVMVAKALSQQAPIILLDEPTAHLDVPNRMLVMRLLQHLAHEQNKTILLSTHELDLALQLSDRVLLMDANGLRLDKPETIKNAINETFGL